MTPFDDDLSEMSAPDSVRDFLDEMRRLSAVAAPEPSAELSALLAGATPLSSALRGRGHGPVRHSRVRRHPLATAAAAAAATTALLVTGAATHRLPASAQRLVSDVVNTVTPFHIDPGDKPVRPGPPTEHPTGAHHSRPGSGPQPSGPSGPAQPSQPSTPGSTRPVATRPVNPAVRTSPKASATTSPTASPTAPATTPAPTPTRTPATTPPSAGAAATAAGPAGSAPAPGGSSTGHAAPGKATGVATGTATANGNAHGKATGGPGAGKGAGSGNGKDTGTGNRGRHAYGVVGHPGSGTGSDGGGRPAPPSPVPSSSVVDEGA